MSTEPMIKDQSPVPGTRYPIPDPGTRTPAVEKAAYLAIGLLAAALRLFQLGLRPLNEAEAEQALAAFRFLHQGGQAAPAGTIPALFTGNVVSFSLLGADDVTARLLPALAGIVLVLLPYGLRHRLGRGGALLAALLLALSPSAVYFSRSLDGAILVAACGLALAVGLVHYVDTRRPGGLYLAAGALGLGLTAGPGIYTLLLVFLAFGLLLYLVEKLRDRESGWSALLVAGWAARDEGGALPTAGIVLGATFGLSALALALHPAGLGLAADQLAAWARGFLPRIGGQPALYLVVAALRYEPLILLPGLVAAVWALAGAWSGRRATETPGSTFPHGAFLAFWAIAAAVLVLIAGHRPPGHLLLVTTPLALLAGEGVARVWRWLRYRVEWPEVGLVATAALILLAFFYLQLAAYSLTNNVATAEFAGITFYTSASYLLLALLALALLVGLGVAVWAWRGGALVAGGGGLAAGIVLGLLALKLTWGLNVAHAADPREILILQPTDPQVRSLVAELELLSVNQAGDAHTLPLVVEADTGPALAWYLREFEQLRVVEALTAPPETLAAVTLAAQDLPIGETFRGQDFALRTRWSPWGAGNQPLVRWLLFNKGYTPIQDQDVVLWVARNP